MPRTWLPLDAAAKRHICEEILRQLEVARDPRRAAWAIKIINECLWFWTVDGQNASGTVGRDKLKYDLDALWHSERACGLSREACAKGHSPTAPLPLSQLRHEHVVPRRVLVARLQAAPRLDAKGIHDLLERCCVGVVLTKEEDAGLNTVFRNDMPPGWSIDDPRADPFARYRHPRVGLFDRLHPPRGRPAGHGAAIPRPAERASAPSPLVIPATARGSQDPWDTAATLAIITDLQARHGLTNAEFKRLHHGKSPSLANHITYCRERTRFTTDTNVDVCRRLLECRGALDKGASWEEAITRALEKHPLPRR